MYEHALQSCVRITNTIRAAANSDENIAFARYALIALCARRSNVYPAGRHSILQPCAHTQHVIYIHTRICNRAYYCRVPREKRMRSETRPKHGRSVERCATTTAKARRVISNY